MAFRSPSKKSSIHEWARKGGNKGELGKILKRDKEAVNRPDVEYHQTPLHILCEEGHKELVTMLIEKYKADINAVDSNGWTPLHLACKRGDLEIVEYLIKKGSFARATTNEQASPLHYLIRNKFTDDVKFLSVLDMFIQKGVNIDSQNKHGETPLHQAALRGRDNSCLFLLKFEANVNMKTNHDETALHFATGGKHESTVQILINYSADPLIVSEKGSVLSYTKKGKDENIRKLLKHRLRELGEEVSDDEGEEMVIDEEADNNGNKNDNNNNNNKDNSKNKKKSKDKDDNSDKDSENNGMNDSISNDKDNKPNKKSLSEEQAEKKTRLRSNSAVLLPSFENDPNKRKKRNHSKNNKAGKPKYNKEKKKKKVVINPKIIVIVNLLKKRLSS
eukprot:TRINITY_DN1115_c0_g2_i1.p1 TRINITY_DN1115_c0_g2~~TRINITY_DN1115_c0_g2_i1.p1  ORF type:complete len:390 (-),score=113.49 TRINITY_DN1115_c0_g2_i1:92-1261(-)